MEKRTQLRGMFVHWFVHSFPSACYAPAPALDDRERRHNIPAFQVLTVYEGETENKQKQRTDRQGQELCREFQKWEASAELLSTRQPGRASCRRGSPSPEGAAWQITGIGEDGGDSLPASDILCSLQSNFQIIQLLFKNSILPKDTYLKGLKKASFKSTTFHSST